MATLFLWSHLGLNQGPPDYESGATNQLSYRTPSECACRVIQSFELLSYGEAYPIPLQRYYKKCIYARKMTKTLFFSVFSVFYVGLIHLFLLTCYSFCMKFCSWFAYIKKKLYLCRLFYIVRNVRAYTSTLKTYAKHQKYSNHRTR